MPAPEDRRPVLFSRKFWCVLICAAIPWINWLTIKMPVNHTIAAMFPFAAYATGEWSMDWVEVLFRSYGKIKNGNGNGGAE